jgi:hypothetical protein
LTFFELLMLPFLLRAGSLGIKKATFTWFY